TGYATTRSTAEPTAKTGQREYRKDGWDGLRRDGTILSRSKRKQHRRGVGQSRAIVKEPIRPGEAQAVTLVIGWQRRDHPPGTARPGGGDPTGGCFLHHNTPCWL